MDRQEQITRLAEVMRNIQVPASDGYPEIDMTFMGPVERIATHMFDVQGVRVVDVTEE